MNRTVSLIRSRRILVVTPSVVAKLNLADEGQRRLHDLIQRFHTGRWPLFRCLGMRQVNGVLYEAVQWLRMAKPSYSVVEWRSDGLGLSWQNAASVREARAMLASLL